MCLMVVKKKEQKFDPEYIKAIYQRGNNDGFGLAYVEGERNEEGFLVKPGRIVKVKSMGDAEELMELYKEHMDKNLIIHLRNATHGEKTIENCHPYDVLNIDDGHKMDIVMMHNGTIRDVQIDKKMSDSWNYATHILRGVLTDRPNMLFESSFRYMLCTMLGTNKLIFMDNRERILVINSDLGSYHAESGVWLSSKEDLKLPKIVPMALPPHGGRSGMSQQFGAGEDVTNTESAMNKIKWLAVGGEWVMEADGRSHFIPDEAVAVKSKKNKSKPSESKKAGRTRQSFAPTDEEIEQGIREAKIEHQDIEEFILSLKDMPQNKINEWVESYPVEAVFVLLKLAKEENMFNELTSRPIKDIVKYAFEKPWEITFAVTLCFRGEDLGIDGKKVVEVS